VVRTEKSAPLKFFLKFLQLLQKEGQRICKSETEFSLLSGFVFSPKSMNQSHVSCAVAFFAYQQENVLTVVLLIALGSRDVLLF